MQQNALSKLLAPSMQLLAWWRKLNCLSITPLLHPIGGIYFDWPSHKYNNIKITCDKDSKGRIIMGNAIHLTTHMGGMHWCMYLL